MMTKKDLKNYQHLKKEREELKARIRRLEDKAQHVPVIKDKVQSSQKEYPYLMTHEVVDAPDPRQYAAIQRAIAMLRARELEIVKKLIEIEDFIGQIPDSRTRRIIEGVFVDGKSQKDIAIELDLTEARVSMIISEATDTQQDS